MKYHIKYISFLLLSILFISCGSDAEGNRREEKNSAKAAYKVTTVKQDTLHYELTLPGELKPYDEVTLYSKIKGFVKDLKVDRGDQVKKGDLLLSIEAPEIQQKLLAAKAKKREITEKLSFSAQNYKRMREAAKVEGAISSIELEQAKAKFLGDSASLSAVKAEVAAAAQLSGYREIRAPFAGVITSRMVSPGALVGSGREPLLELSREDKLRLVVAVPSKHANALPLSTKASFSVNSAPGKEFPVSLSRSSKALDPQKRSLMVEFDYDNPNNQLKAGSYARVYLDLERNQPSLKVPASSIINTKTHTFVAKVNSGTVQLIPVVTGITQDDFVEVFGNVHAGDQVVVKGNSTLKDGMEIRAIKS